MAGTVVGVCGGEGRGSHTGGLLSRDSCHKWCVRCGFLRGCHIQGTGVR